MDELIKLVSEKTGLSKEQAAKAVETVIDYLKDRLPKPVAGQIENVLSQGGSVDAEGLAKGLGDMLGGN